MACPKQKMFLAAFISVVSSYDISNVIKNPPILIAIYGYFHRQPWGWKYYNVWIYTE